MSIEAKAKQAKSLELTAKQLYITGDIDKAISVEKEYLKLRLEVINEVTADIQSKKSKTLKEVKADVAKRPPIVRRATGIESLDRELISPKDYGRGKIGGFALGNFIQVVGSRGSGKSTILMKIITNLSRYEVVCWFDFEMGEVRVVEKINQFLYNEDNLLYYNASRDIEDVISEIKFLHAMGVNHFVIDSTMKITVQGLDEYQRNKQISSKLSELTSTLNINIYIINQMNKNDEANQIMQIKHGNDVEYDADFIFFILSLPKKENGKIIKDEFGQAEIDESFRIIKCVKNRQDERKFTIKINKSELITTHTEIEFKSNTVDMPKF